MGAAESQPLPPWFAAADVEYPPPIRDALIALSTTATPFLTPHPHYFHAFDLESHLPRLQGALTFDRHIARWYPALVPRRVSEPEFWRNYFSHVAAIVNEGEIPVATGTAEETLSLTPVGEESTSQEAPPTANSQTPRVGNDAQAGSGGVSSPPSSTAALTIVSAGVAPAASSGFADLHLALPPPTHTIDPQRLIGAPALRWGVVGCGVAAQTLALPALACVNGARVVALMGRDPTVARSVAARFGVTRVHASVAALLADAEVDAVYIATPPGTHAAIALEAARARKPCFVERVLARTATEARILGDEFARAAVPLYACQPRRFLTKFRAAQHLIAARIGRVLSLQYSCVGTYPRAASSGTSSGAWRLDAELAGGGPAIEVATDLFDLVDFLLGPVTHVQADAAHVPPEEVGEPPAPSSTAASATSPSSSSPRAARAPLENMVTATFRTSAQTDGSRSVLGTASFTFACAPPSSSASASAATGEGGAVSEGRYSVDELVVVGTRGRVVLSLYGDEGPALFSLSGPPSRVVLPTPTPSRAPLLQTVTNEARLWRAACAAGSHAAATVLHGAPLATRAAPQSIRVALAVDACLRTYYRDRLDAFWTRPHTWRHEERANANSK